MKNSQTQPIGKKPPHNFRIHEESALMHSPPIIYLSPPPYPPQNLKFYSLSPLQHATFIFFIRKHARTARLNHTDLTSQLLLHVRNSNTGIHTLTRHHARPPRLSKLGQTKQLALNQLIKRRITVYSIAQSIKGKRPLREIYSTAFQQTYPFRPRLFPKIVIAVH